jgi:hypothetical protein
MASTVGQQCSRPDGCYTGICTNGLCAAPPDCSTNPMQLGCPTTACVPGAPACPGASCSADSQCFSGKCGSGKCSTIDCTGPAGKDPGCACDGRVCFDAIGGCPAGGGACSPDGRTHAGCNVDAQCGNGMYCDQKMQECAAYTPGQTGAVCPDGKCADGYQCAVEPGTTDGRCKVAPSVCSAPVNGECPKDTVVISGLTSGSNCCPLSVFGGEQLTVAAGSGCHVSQGPCASSEFAIALDAATRFCCNPSVVNASFSKKK